MPHSLAGRMVLIVARDFNEACRLQDSIVNEGGRVVTAYSLERALLVAKNSKLSDAMIEAGFEGDDQITRVLHERKTPHVQYSVSGFIASPAVWEAV